MVQALIRQSACIADLKRKAKRRVPGFVFDYIEGGCNSDLALRHNREALDAVHLRPDYLSKHTPPLLRGFSTSNETSPSGSSLLRADVVSASPRLSTFLFDKEYASPFGIAPLGLSGLFWPDASAMHARAARAANIPFVLSTVSTVSIEDAAKHAGENFWFQLYPPSDLEIRTDLIKRAKDSGCKNLVVTIDVPSAGRRIKDIKNGLAVPPKITAKSILQSAMRPAWSLATMKAGLPQFASLQPYIKDRSNIEDVANFIRLTLRDVVDEAMLRDLRKDWDGNLIVKGINSVEDAKIAVNVGADGIIVSNHGGRQLDAALASATVLPQVVDAMVDKTMVIVDSGVESGVDIARYLALGAKAVFAGRAFAYGVAAHGEIGAQHTIDLLSEELQQVMSQLHCADISELPNYLIE